MISNKPTVSIVDDNADLRSSLNWMLTKEGLKVKTYESAEDFLENYDPNLPGCVLLDLRMPGMNGLQVQKRMIEQDWIAPVIIISAHADVQTAVAAMQAGAMHLLEKPFSRKDLLDRIHVAVEKDQESRRYQSMHAELEARIAKLTVREREVMEMIIDGKTTKQIGHLLGVSVRTLEIHRSRILNKMGVESTTQLVSLTMRYGLCDSNVALGLRGVVRGRAEEVARRHRP